MSGDRTFKKIKVTIDGNDISDSWYGINIYQSLDAPTWSCDVNIMDGSNLLETLPILHGSQLKIEIETQDNCSTDMNNEFVFYIYRIDNKIANNQNVETYKLKGVTKAFLVNKTLKISEKFSSKKASTIVSEISTKYFDDMITLTPTESDNNTEILINSWDPFYSIAWVLKQCHKDNRADFLYFQNGNNTFCIDSIENMYSSTDNRIDEVITYKVENTGEIFHYNIIKHAWEHVDVQQNLHNGYYKSTVTSYDFMNKSWNESIYSHGDDNKEDLKIAPQWKDSLFDSSEKSVVSFAPKMPSTYTNTTGYDDADKWLPSRRAVLQRLDSEKFSAQMRGSVGTYMWLGKNIFIDLPNNNEPSGEFYSRFRKGYYLVSAIVHHITPSMYINNFEFVKMRVEE